MDGGRVIKVDFLLVIDGGVPSVSKLTTAEECLREAGHNVDLIGGLA